MKIQKSNFQIWVERSCAVLGLLATALAFTAFAGWLVGVLALLLFGLAGYSLQQRRVRSLQLLEAMAELKEWKEQSKLFLRCMGEGMFGLDLEGKVTLINRAAMLMLGYRSEEILGMHIQEILPTSSGSDAQGGESPKSQASVNENLSVEVTGELFRRRDGTFFPVAYTCSPILVDQVIKGAVYIFRDDTEHRRNQTELRKSNEFIRSILDHAHSLIYAKNESGEYLMANRLFHRVFGFSESSVIGKTDHDLFPKELADLRRRMDLQVVITGNPVQVEEEASLKDGIHHYLTLKFPLKGLDDEVYAVVGMSTDITDRVRQQHRLAEYLEKIETINRDLQESRQRAEAARLAKSAFLANMSHEIRTPLNGVIGIASLLEQTELDDRQRKYVQRIALSGKVLLGLISDILDYSKMEACQLKLESIPTDLYQLLREMGEIFGVQAEDKKLDLVISVDPKAPRDLMVDALRLRQVILNLMNNAIKFTKAGYVVLKMTGERLSNDQSSLRIEVKDSGVGIPEDKRDLLFHKFYQADDSSTREYGGAGLGLAICKQLVDLMGGHIGFSSGEGVGSTFWVELVLPNVPASESKASVSKNQQVEDLKGVSVLIVDDLEVNLDLLKGLASHWGMHMQLCRSANEALHYVKDHKVQLALIDYTMPDMDGLELGRILHNQESTKDIPLILLSSVQHMSDESYAHNGFSCHLTKPVMPEELLRAIHSVLPQKYAKN